MIPPSGGCCFPSNECAPLADAAGSRTMCPSGGCCSLERMRPSGGCCSLSNECAPQKMMLKSMVWLSHHLPLTFVLPSSLVVSCCLSASSIATMSPVLM